MKLFLLNTPSATYVSDEEGGILGASRENDLIRFCRKLDKEKILKFEQINHETDKPDLLLSTHLSDRTKHRINPTYLNRFSTESIQP